MRKAIKIFSLERKLFTRLINLRIIDHINFRLSVKCRVHSFEAQIMVNYDEILLKENFNEFWAHFFDWGNCVHYVLYHFLGIKFVRRGNPAKVIGEKILKLGKKF